MAKIIAIANQKGGVGKTTTSISVATGLQELGYKTLLIDCEPQRSATTTYRAKVENTATLYDLFFSDIKSSECVQHTEVGDIIAGDPLLGDTDEFPRDENRMFLLKTKCEELRDLYDFIVIDTPPGIGIILMNALTCADIAFVPTTLDEYGISGMEDIKKTLDSIKENTNTNLKVGGIVITRYRGLNYEKQIEEYLLPSVEKMMETKAITPYIRECVQLRRSQTAQESIFTFAPGCTTGLDYMELCKMIEKGEI